MKAPKIIFVILLSVVSLLTCEVNPITGETTLAFVSDSELFAMSFQEYDKFLSENVVISNTDPKYGKDARKVEEIGENIRKAAEKWYKHQGKPDYLKNYKWEYKLVKRRSGKRVVYAGRKNRGVYGHT